MLWFLAACTHSTAPLVDADGDGVAAGEDCDDGDAAVFPGANEFCDGLDNDCNGAVDDEPWGLRSYYRDRDGDGFGTTAVQACERPQGYAPAPGDCDDHDPAISPRATEVCDGRDDDCNGTVDDALVYQDADGDGFGIEHGATALGCTLPGFARTTGDCDDDDAQVFPGAVERCTGRDDDCDGRVDDEDQVSDPPTWYPDADGDGIGTDAFSQALCDPGPDWSQTAGDCDDFDATVFPGAPERCDAVDRDCDGETDDPDGAYELGASVGFEVTASAGQQPLFVVAAALPAGASDGDRVVAVFGDCATGFEPMPARFLDDGSALGIDGSTLVVAYQGALDGTRTGRLYLDADPVGTPASTIAFDQGAVTEATLDGTSVFEQQLVRPGITTPSGLLALDGPDTSEVDLHPSVSRWVFQGSTTNPSGSIDWRSEWVTFAGFAAIAHRVEIVASGPVLVAVEPHPVGWFAMTPLLAWDGATDPIAFEGVPLSILEAPATTGVFGLPDTLRLASDAAGTLADGTTITGRVGIGAYDEIDRPTLVLVP